MCFLHVLCLGQLKLCKWQCGQNQKVPTLLTPIKIQKRSGRHCPLWVIISMYSLWVVDWWKLTPSWGAELSQWTVIKVSGLVSREIPLALTQAAWACPVSLSTVPSGKPRHTGQERQDLSRTVLDEQNHSRNEFWCGLSERGWSAVGEMCRATTRGLNQSGSVLHRPSTHYITQRHVTTPDMLHSYSTHMLFIEPGLIELDLIHLNFVCDRFGACLN